MNRFFRCLSLLMCLVLITGSVPVFADTSDGGAQPSPQPTVFTADETAEPTAEPTAENTVEPTEEPTAEPTAEPTEETTAEPTADPTAEPTPPPEPPMAEPPAAQPAVGLGVTEVSLDITEGRNGIDPVLLFMPEFTDIAADDIVWTSSDESIAVFDDGMLVLLDKGGFTVRASLVSDDTVFAEAAVEVGIELRLEGTPASVQEEDVFTLRVVYKDGADVPADMIKWSTSDAACASVDGGTVTALRAGDAVISAECHGETLSADITVSPRKVGITASFEPIYSNGSGAILVAPADEGEVIDPSRLSFTPDEGYERYFTIDKDGSITPVAPEGAWVTGADGSDVYVSSGVLEGGVKSVTVNVRVEHRGSSVDVPVTIKQAAVGAYSGGVIEIPAGGSRDISEYAHLEPRVNGDEVASIVSSDETMFTVSGTEVFAHLPGNGHIIVTTASGEAIYIPVYCPTPTTEIKLTAPKGNMRIGDEVQIAMKRYPEGSDGRLEWTSSNREIATVDQTGRVTFLKPGEVTIKVVVVSTGVSASVKLKVIRPAEGFTLYKGMFPDKTSYVVAVGKTLTPVIDVYPANASDTGYYLESSDSSILEVYNGGKSVRGKNPGYATVTVRSADGEATMKLNFTVPKKKYAITRFSLSYSSVTITEGSSKTVKAKLNSSAYDKTVEWVSTDPEIATVKNGKIVGVNPGKCTVYAINSAGQYKSVKVTVKLKVPSKVKLNVTKGSMYVGEEYQFKATLSPAGLTREEATALKWGTSNRNVVIVNEEGKIFAISPGTAKITVTTVNGKKATCKVTVKPYKVKSVKITHPYTEFIVGGTYDLDVIVGPDNATNPKVKWSTSSSSRATIDKNTGVLKCKKTGTVTITAKAADGSGKKHSIKINIVKLPLKSSSITIGGKEVEEGATYTIEYKDTLQISVSTDPVMSIEYKSSDERTASVDANGLITATGCGTAKITVTAGGQYKRTFKVKVPYHKDAPRYRALVISQFNDSDAKGYLPFSVNSTSGFIDAISLSDLEGSRYDVTYKKDFTKPEQVVNSITATFADARDGDVSVIYIITHGNIDPNGDFRWLLTEKGKKQVWLYPGDVMDALADIHGDVVLVVLSCYSGGDVEQEGTLRYMVNGLDNGGGVGSSYSVICSTDGATRSSYANTAASFSYDFFTYGLCMSLGWDMNTSQKAATSADTDGDGRITLKELAKATKVVTKQECERFVEVYGTSGYWGPTKTERTQNVQYYISDKAVDLPIFSVTH